jgi:hypothetical protein
MNKRVEYVTNHYKTARGSSSGLFQEAEKKDERYLATDR